MNLENKKISFGLLFLWILLQFLSFYGWYSSLGRIASGLLVVVLGLLIWRAFRVKNVVLIILFLFIGMYAMVPMYIFWENLYPTSRAADCNIVHFFDATMIFLFFMILLSYFCSFSRNKQQDLPYTVSSDRFIWFVNIVVSFLIMLFGKRGETILDGGYGISESQNSNLNEYFIIFILLAYLYSSRSKFQMIVFYSLIAVYVVKNLLYGGRIETVEVGILLVCIITQYKFTLKRHLILLLGAFSIIALFGLLRSNADFLLTGNLDLEKMFSSGEKTCIESNEGDVFYASSRMFLLMDSGYLDLLKRLESFFYYVGLVFVPSSCIPDVGVLSSYKVDLYGSGGGGLAPIFYFVYLGYLGVALLAYFCGKVFFALCAPPNKIMMVYSILFAAMIPRWFAYYPIHLIKFCLYGIMVFVVFDLFKAQMCKK